MVAAFMRLFQRNRLAEGYVWLEVGDPHVFVLSEVIGQIPQKGQKKHQYCPFAPGKNVSTTIFYPYLSRTVWLMDRKNKSFFPTGRMLISRTMMCWTYVRDCADTL